MPRITGLARAVRALAICAERLPMTGLAAGITYEKPSKTLGIRTPGVAPHSAPTTER
ncbi:hypothetical protein JQX13_01385 [Archangium violaceum]|uniref:hypothetical protein n=1 Tax=Archangium violaceum TaxID=83451 RepID=UPI00193B55A6|nr:hypothetical protein [Archangium violaceum]QRK08854.1 hypothetical protein JQX13_01385 [Archangium violaceum]